MESALIFLGTGVSGTVPSMRCLIDPSDPPCLVCTQSLSLPPHLNPNYRCNTSLLIDYYSQSDATHKYILIDAGKTFRETILLTHEHADAVLGLDDIRAVQPFSPTNDIDPTPIYLTRHSMDSMEKVFPYLVQKKHKEGQEIRRVAQCCWNIIADDCNLPFSASGLKFIPLPVMHGEDYICLGFLFGEKDRVAYISDVSRIPASTEYVISKSGAGQLDLLILDTLKKIKLWESCFWFFRCFTVIKNTQEIMSNTIRIEKFNGKNNFNLWRIKMRALLKEQCVWAPVASTSVKKPVTSDSK
ncbi:putative hydrolase [Glycine soja]|uniref:Putative hydrolase n=1 Tax=Glycine soja TaxID=3848 RepID=A0A445KNB7_GLYSO|nr:putative hydrolase [Glycine soja]